MATLKHSESSRVTNNETGKAFSQTPLPFCVVASNLALVTWSASRNILSQFSLTIGRSQSFWSLGSSGKEAPPLAPFQDSTASASSLVFAMLNNDPNSSFTHNHLFPSGNKAFFLNVFNYSFTFLFARKIN